MMLLFPSQFLFLGKRGWWKSTVRSWISNDTLSKTWISTDFWWSKVCDYRLPLELLDSLWGCHLRCSSKYQSSLRRQREDTFSRLCAEMLLLHSSAEKDEKFGAEDLGTRVWAQRSRMVTWITVWNRSTPHSACLNHRREPVSTGIGIILFIVCVKQSSLTKNWNFFLHEMSKSA